MPGLLRAPRVGADAWSVLGGSGKGVASESEPRAEADGPHRLIEERPPPVGVHPRADRLLRRVGQRDEARSPVGVERLGEAPVSGRAGGWIGTGADAAELLRHRALG